MLDEKKGTCCHKCGHVHVKGTKCPTPYLKGERSCARRSVKEVETNVNEMSLQNPGVEDFLKDLESHPDIREKMGFTSMKGVLDFLDLASTRDWSILRKELEKHKESLQNRAVTEELIEEYRLKRKEAYSTSNGVEYFRNAKKVVSICGQNLKNIIDQYNANL